MHAKGRSAMEPQHKIPLFVNPLSRKNRMQKGASIRTFQKMGGERIQVIAPADFDELDRAVSRCRAESVQYVAISGGDGTIHQVLTRFIVHYRDTPVPPILILKDGTMNNISETIRLRGSGNRILKRFLAALDGGAPMRTERRNTLRIGDRYCFLFGNGLATNVLDAVYEGDDKGFLKRVRVVLLAIGECITNTGKPVLFKRLRGRVSLDGNLLPCDDFIGVLAGTVETVGMGFAPLAPMYPGERSFHVIATALTPREVLKNIFKLRKGRPIGSPRHFYAHVSELRLESPDAFTYTMDGDLYRCDGTLMVGLGPVVSLVYV
jgi:diacylglycerol kinase family enzyme